MHGRAGNRSRDSSRRHGAWAVATPPASHQTGRHQDCQLRDDPPLMPTALGRCLTKDGFELTFGTNHLAHFVWTETLLPRVTGRIVNVSSAGHYSARGIDWDTLRTTTSVSGLPEYFVSKLCNVLYTNELARRLAGRVTTYSLHPGGVASDIWKRRLGVFAGLLRPFLITNERGARTQVRCATDPALAGETGMFYSNERKQRPSALALDVALQDELTARSRVWVG